jgi:hypothetical protein
MIRIASTLVVLTLAGTAAAATAANTSFPSSAQETYSQYQVFPNMETYASWFSDSAERQAPTTNAGGAQAHARQVASENSRVAATCVDAPTRNVSPHDQTQAQSPFPLSFGPED